jgi:hypothetical protein
MHLPDLYEPFLLRVAYQDKILLGKIRPWMIPRDSVIPTRFTVYIDDLYIGHIIFRDDEWREFDGKKQERGFLEAVGEYIAIWYE